MTGTDRTSPDALADGRAVAIGLDRLSKRFPGTTVDAVGDLSLDIPAGAIVVLVGPSGCGKTTTLKMINRLIEPTGGRVLIGGIEASSLPIHELRRRIGYVIQHTGLFPHKTIEANIGTVPRLLGWPKREIRDRVAGLVDLLGLDQDMLRRYPPELSGGQQQRVGVARALAADPPVLLMDEPYSAVDPIVRAHLQDELLELQARVEKTIVLVTHDIDEAIKLGDRIAILNVGGVLEQFAPPTEVLSNPASPFVESFLGDDRSLKRLALLKVGDVELSQGPMVPADLPPSEARRIMDEHRADWIGVLDGRRVRGWISGNDLNGQPSVGDIEATPFGASVTPETTLRQALDRIVTSHNRVALVLDEAEHYLGLVTIDEIGRGGE